MVRIRLKKILLILFAVFGLFLLLMVVIPVIIFWNWSFGVSGYCEKKAQSVVGDRWAELLPPTIEEKQAYPDLDSIAYGFREQLKCERDPATQEKFKYWFGFRG